MSAPVPGSAPPSGLATVRTPWAQSSSGEEKALGGKGPNPVRTRFGSNRVRTGFGPVGTKGPNPVQTRFGSNRVRTGFGPVGSKVRTRFELNRVRTGFGPGSDQLEPKVRTRFEPNRVRTGFGPGSDQLEPKVRTGSCLDICDSAQTGSNRFRTFGSIGSNPVRTRSGFEAGSDRLEPKVPAGSNPFHVWTGFEPAGTRGSNRFEPCFMGSNL